MAGGAHGLLALALAALALRGALAAYELTREFALRELRRVALPAAAAAAASSIGGCDCGGAALTRYRRAAYEKNDEIKLECKDAQGQWGPWVVCAEVRVVREARAAPSRAGLRPHGKSRCAADVAWRGVDGQRSFLQIRRGRVRLLRLEAGQGRLRARIAHRLAGGCVLRCVGARASERAARSARACAQSPSCVASRSARTVACSFPSTSHSLACRSPRTCT